MRFGRCVLAMPWLTLSLTLSTHARAETVAPILVDGVEATVPDHLDIERPIAVELELTIDAKGHVSSAEVIEGPGEPFEVAALEAVRRFRFAPATQDGIPIAVRIRYRYVFEASPRKEAAPPPGDEPGKVDPVPPVPTRSPPDPSGAAAAEVEEPSYQAEAVVQAPPRAPTRRTVEREELTRVPGTQGDAIRAIELLPGVGRSPFGTDPILRGASGFETKVFFDGAPVPLLYHFGGIKSFVNARLVDRIDLYPGNFSSRYGRLVGGVIDVRSRDLETDAFHGVVELSLLDSSALVEAPLGDRAAVALAARRSNIDFVFENFVPDGAFSVVAAPLYWDYQAIGQVDVGRKSRLRLMAYGSRDSLEFFFDEPDEVDPTLRGSLEGALAFHRIQANLESAIGSKVEHDLMLNVGTESGTFVLGPTSERVYETLDLGGRSEWKVAVSRDLDVIVGIDAMVQYIEGEYVGDQPPQQEGEPEAERFGTRELVKVVDAFWLASPAGYLEMLVRPTERLLLVPGLRVDYFHQIRAASLNPRLALRYALTPSTQIKGGVGLFSQPPLYWEALTPLGNPALDPYHALHQSLGVEQQIGETLTVEVEGFYKRLIDRVVATPGGAPPGFVNDGDGRIAGMELGTTWRPATTTFAHLAYTLSRSERRDHNGAYRLFDYDQTHVLSVAANQDLGRGWELGARFRYVTGNPITPVIGAQYDANRDLYRPIYGAANSARASAFHQADVRIQKTWQVASLGLSAYLEVINAYNAENQEGIDYGYDYRKKESVSGFPVFPNIGVRGEL